MRKRLSTPQQWRQDFAQDHPVFEPFRSTLASVNKAEWPSLHTLNLILSKSPPVEIRKSVPLTAVSQKAPLKARDYDREIYFRGHLPTREANWHDLLNLLCWRQFPKTRRWINHQQVLAADNATNHERSPRMHLLTHLDECGVAIVSDKLGLLDAIRNFEWETLFWQQRPQLSSHLRVTVFGHGLYEQLLNPHLGTIGRALLIHVDRNTIANLRTQTVDHLIVDHLHSADAPVRSRDLSPFPLLGLPGWFKGTEDRTFYRKHTDYFRPGRISREERQANPLNP